MLLPCYTPTFGSVKILGLICLLAVLQMQVSLRSCCLLQLVPVSDSLEEVTGECCKCTVQSDPHNTLMSAAFQV